MFLPLVWQYNLDGFCILGSLWNKWLLLCVMLAETLAEEFYSSFGTVLWESLHLLDRVRGKQENLMSVKCSFQGKLESYFLWFPELKNLAVPGLCVMLLSLYAVNGGTHTVQLFKLNRPEKLMEVPLWLRLNIKVSKEFCILFYFQIIMLAKSPSFLKFCMLCLCPREVHLASQSLYLWKAHSRDFTEIHVHKVYVFIALEYNSTNHSCFKCFVD